MHIFRSDERPPVYTPIPAFVDTFVQFCLSDVSPERELPVVIGHQGASLPTRAILYNCEQMSRGNQLSAFLNKTKDPNVAEVWDYSRANVDILATHGVVARHVPLCTPDTYMSEIQEYCIQPKVYDVGFCGGISERRRQILHTLHSAGITVCTVKKWGKDRDIELGRCRVILNIHYANDYTIFESARCEPWLATGVPVITESSMDDDPRCAVIAPYNELVEKTICFLRGLRETSTCPQTCPSSP
jgi:hypothetical protein